MDAPRWKGTRGRSEGYPEEVVRASYGRISRICRSSGLSPVDSEDVAQDVWTWILRAAVPIALIETPWLTPVVQNYVLRFKRQSHRRLVREGQPLEKAPEPKAWQPEAQLESKELLDRVASLLPERERRLLALIRRGYTLPEAALCLRVPRGSRNYCQGRLIARARRELKRKGVLPARTART